MRWQEEEGRNNCSVHGGGGKGYKGSSSHERNMMRFLCDDFRAISALCTEQIRKLHIKVEEFCQIEKKNFFCEGGS